MSSKISINGTTFSGKSINIKNNKILIDGLNVTPDNKIITILVNGNVDILQTDVCETIKIAGDVKDLSLSAGNIEVIGDCHRDVKTSAGNIKCENVTGNVSTGSGDITCENISGSAKAMCGDINRR